MEQELLQEPHPDYLQGFNEGYLLQEQTPALAAIVATSLEHIDSQRSVGFKAGCLQFQQEREKILTLTWMQPEHTQYDDIVPEPDKDDVDIEPE